MRHNFNLTVSNLDIEPHSGRYIDINFDIDLHEVYSCYPDDFNEIVIDSLKADDVIDLIEWDDVSGIFHDEIIEEVTNGNLEIDVLDTIGWDAVREYFKDYIDAEVSERLQQETN